MTGMLIGVISLMNAKWCEQEATWRSPVADQLKTCVCNIGNVSVGKNGIVSAKAALNSFASDATSAFASRSAALRYWLSSLHTEISSAQGQPPLAAGTEVVSSVTIGRASEEPHVGSTSPWLPADGLARA